MPSFPKWMFMLGAIALLTPLALYGWRCLQRPPRTDTARSLFQGITYRRDARDQPRPLMIHIVEVDLTAPGIDVLVTPGQPAPDLRETDARTTSEFLQEFNLQVAVNANFFYPFSEKTPWDFYPHSGDRVNSVGQAISNGFEYSYAQPKWAVLCFDANHRAQILATGVCPAGTQQGVAGSDVLVAEGQPVQKEFTVDSDDIYSRTVVALNSDGTKLWVIAIDDKQPLYSEGVTLEEMAAIALELGANTALNLDGGGSTTLVTATPSGFEVLNAPIHSKLPMRERPVANHLGFYAVPQR